ncbi:epoxide hydrolase family protein [Paracoccus aerius]|uniref:Epoxide hydrolase n=1 Tax=Paracoccus aerius TaxID=1915382 RepID=A0ABS1S852_9RHOB|nr:epoxide hydrolase family protein [Paracoccus aerius]MBL3673837.1 epoxide hydrolase [Paracoccus aerius]GHG32452.1 hydrolase [Paracoccus aerius]
MSDAVRSFTLDIPQHQIKDLGERLSRTRWPDRSPIEDGRQGPPLEKLRALVTRWQDGYDWRRCEALLNGWNQHITQIDGIDIHFLHVRSAHPKAMPLLLTHGWPGSVLEFRHVIDPLVNPTAHGGTEGDAFHLVIPSLPGFGFSGKPTEPGWTAARIAAAWATLMTRLGYDRWGAQGGDWGAMVTMILGHMAPESLAGIHLNFVPFQPSQAEIANADAEERQMLSDAAGYDAEYSAYMKLQATRPQSVAFALADSPVGLAAWIYALFQDVSDSGGDPESVFGLDEMIDDIMLYWLPNAGPSSARLYWEGMNALRAGGMPQGAMRIPAGISMFRGEQVRLSRRWAEARFERLVHFAEHARGGHFAALERPDAFVKDLRSTFEVLR